MRRMAANQAMAAKSGSISEMTAKTATWQISSSVTS